MIKHLPLVSIIMPAYNAEKYIVESIESVINQSYKKWELIIVNDGSIDSTKQLIQQFNDNRIKYFYQENRGVSSARNTGMIKAKGEFITFVDADDTLPKTSIELRVTFFEKSPDIDLVHGIASIRNENLGKELKTRDPFKYDSLLNMMLTLDNRLFFNPSYMIRKKNIAGSKFNEGMTHCEDILFLFSLLHQGYSYASISKPVYIYRVSSSSAMSNIDAMIDGYIELLKSIKIKRIGYSRTVIMRLKIIRIILSWTVRSGNIRNLKNLYKAII